MGKKTLNASVWQYSRPECLNTFLTVLRSRFYKVDAIIGKIGRPATADIAIICYYLLKVKFCLYYLLYVLNAC